MSKVKHPWPWKWDMGAREQMPQLLDADGEAVCDFGWSTQYYPTEGSPPDDERILELIRAAPELADVLSEILDNEALSDISLIDRAQKLLVAISTPKKATP